MAVEWHPLVEYLLACNPVCRGVGPGNQYALDPRGSQQYRFSPNSTAAANPTLPATAPDVVDFRLAGRAVLRWVAPHDGVINIKGRSYRLRDLERLVK